MNAAGDLEVRVAALLRQSAPFAYCDSCLALRLTVPAEAAREAALSLLASTKDFERVMRICYGCERARHVIALR